jgi:hypothetical protein
MATSDEQLPCQDSPNPESTPGRGDNWSFDPAKKPDREWDPSWEQDSPFGETWDFSRPGIVSCQFTFLGRVVSEGLIAGSDAEAQSPAEEPHRDDDTPHPAGS